MAQPKIIRYTNLLHSHGLGFKAAEAYKEEHLNDKVFQKRAETLDTLFVMWESHD